MECQPIVSQIQVAEPAIEECCDRTGLQSIGDVKATGGSFRVTESAVCNRKIEPKCHVGGLRVESTSDRFFP